MRIRDFISSKINEVENTKFWRPWEARNYAMTGREVCENAHWCTLKQVAVKAVFNIQKGCEVLHISNNPTVMAEVRQHIANRLGVNIEHIDTDIKIPVGDFYNCQGTGNFGEGVVRQDLFGGGPFGILLNFRNRWDIYNIGYNYREPAPEVANNILNEIAPILDIIPEITSYQNSNSSYIAHNSQKSQEIARKNQEVSQKKQETAQTNRQVSQKSQEVSWKNQEVSQKNQEIAQKNREITEVQQKIAGLQSQENSLQSQINSFQIGDNIKALNAKQKAHILQKLWGNGDADSVSVINAIKQYGFDPHYVHKNGQSLTQLALSKNDTALFDLLIANKIDFNISNANLTIFKLVLDSGNSNFISKMFATGQDFTKSLLDVVLKDDAVMLDKIFSHKAELSQVSYSGYSLLQLALKHGCYKAAEQILRSNPQAINQLTTKGMSALQLAVLTDDKPGIELLKKFGANFELELKNAISKNYGKNVTKILEANPELLNKLEAQGNSPLYHALLQNKLAIAESLLNKGADSKIVMQKALAENNLQMIKDLVALNADSAELVISDNKPALYLALEQDTTEIAKLLLKTSDLMSVVRLSADKAQANIAIKLIKLEPSLLANLAQIENSKVIEKLLEDSGFISLVESLADNNGNNLLHLACKNNNHQLATEILEKNHIDVNKQNSEGKTVFHILLENSADFAEKSQLAEVLLKHHPDIHVSDTSGHTPIDLAVEHYAGILAMFYQQNLMGDSAHTDLN